MLSNIFSWKKKLLVKTQLWRFPCVSKWECAVAVNPDVESKKEYGISIEEFPKENCGDRLSELRAVQSQWNQSKK